MSEGTLKYINYYLGKYQQIRIFLLFLSSDIDFCLTVICMVSDMQPILSKNMDFVIPMQLIIDQML